MIEKKIDEVLMANRRWLRVWEATLSTFLAKLITAGTFAIPVLLFELRRLS